jgi:hypothetical protein
VYHDDILVRVLTEERRRERELIERHNQYLAELGPLPTNKRRLRRSLAAALAAVVRLAAGRGGEADCRECESPVTGETGGGVVAQRTEGGQAA